MSGLEMNKKDAPYEGETGTKVGHLEDKKGPIQESRIMKS